MADIESNIDININASDALANIKNLQRQISAFHQSMAKSGAQANAVSAQMQNQLVNTINATGNFSASMRTVATTTESFTTALEKNKLSMGEYFRFAGGSTRAFGKLFRTEFDTVEKVARERVKTLQTQYIKMGRDASGAMKAIEVRPLTLDMQDLGTKTAIAAQKQQIFNQLLKQGSTNLLNFGKNTQWAGRQLMVGFTIPLGMMGAAASREFMKIEEQALRFKRVYGETFTASSETDKMIDQVKLLADEFTKYGVSIEKTMGLAADAAAMGKQGADLISQVSQANKLAVLGGVDQSQALETTISLTNAFGTATDKLSGKVNFLNAVENQTVTSIEDLTEAIPKAGPVVQQLGGDVEDLAFFMTAMKEGGIDAGEGANALKSGLASMINPTQEAVDMLSQYNINLRGIVDANKGDVAGTVVEFARALDGLDPLDRAKAIETLFGKFQFARMSTLFQNVIAEGSQASRVLQLTQATTEELAVLADREMKRIEDSPMYKFKGAMEDFKASLAPVGEAFLKAVTPIIEFGTSILSKFNEMGDGAKQFWTVAIAAVAGLGPVLLMTFGLMANGLANVVKMFGVLGGLFNRSANQSTILGQQTDYMSQQQLEAAAIAASLNQVHSSLIQTFTSEASAVDRLTAAYTKAAAAGNAIRQPMTARAGGKAPKKYASGVVSVPGSGRGDTVPAMLTPGEAVIPAEYAKRYAPLINGMVAGTIPGYVRGKRVTMADYNADTGGDRRRVSISGHAEKLAAAGYPEATNILISDLESANVSVVEARRILSRLTQALAQGGNAVSEMFESVETSLDKWKASGSKNSKELTETLDDITGAATARKERAKQTGQFTHVGSGVTMSAKDYKAKFGTEKLNQSEIQQLDRLIKQNKTVDIKSGLGMAGFDPNVNRALAAEGTGKKELEKAFSDAGVQKWNQSIKIGGGNVDELSGSVKKFDAKLQSLISGVKDGTKIFDTRAQAEAFMAKNAGKVATSFEQLYATAIRTADPKLREALYGAQTTAREVRMGGSARRQKKLPTAVSGVLVAQADAELSGADVTPAQEKKTRKRKVDAEKLEADLAEKKAKTQAVSESHQRGWVTRKKNLEDKRLAEEAARLEQEKKNSRRGKVAGAISPGRIGMAGMGASMALGMASSMGGPVGDIAGQAMGPVAAISGVASVLGMIPGPAGIAVAAIGGVVAGVAAIAIATDNWRGDAIKLAEALGSGTKAMKSLAEFAGTVSAGQTMDKRRENKFSRFQVQEGKTSFGESFMGSDAGKALLESVKKELESGGLSDVQSLITNQMATAVASGVLDAGQARSIVAALANELGDQQMGMDINGKLISLLGPNGEDLAKDPIGVRLKIMDETGAALEDTNALLAEISTQGYNPFSDWFWDVEKYNKAVADSVAAQAMSLQQNQEMLDSLDLEYEKRIAAAKAAGDMAEADRLLEEQQQGRSDLMAKNAKDILAISQSYATASAGLREDLDASADKMIDSTYAGTAMAPAAEKAKGAIKGANLTNEQDYTMRVMLGSGDLNPTQLNKFLESFGQNGTVMESFFNINADLGSATSSQAMEIVNMMTDETKQEDFMLRVDAMSTEGATKYLDMLAQVTKVGEVAKLDAVVEFYAENEAAGAELMADIEEFKAAQEEGPITLDVVQRVFGTEVADIVSANWEYFNGLDKDQQLTYTQTIKTIYQTIGTPDFDSGFNAWLGEKGKKQKNGKAYKYNTANGLSKNEAKLANEYMAAQAYKVTEASKQIGNPASDPADDPANDPGSSGGGGSTPSSILDDLTKKLKQVQMNTLAVTKGWAASRTALDNLFPAGGSNSPFNGIEQSMRRLGAKEDLITMIAGMDPEEFEKRKDELFTFDGAGNIVGFRNSLLSIGAALRSIKFGEFQSQQQKNVSIYNDQIVATRKLVAAGFSYAEAYDMVKDAALASAVAQESNNDIIKQATADYKAAEAAAKNFAAAQAVAGNNQKVVDQKKLIEFMNANADQFTETQKNAIMSDENLQRLVLNPEVDPISLQQALTNAQQKAALELEVKKLTVKGMEEIFQDGFNKAMESFSAQEKRIELEFKLKKDPFTESIEGAKQVISDIQNGPGGLDDLDADLTRISDKEKDIVKAYDDKNKALDKIQEANDIISRQQRSQLSIADALSQGDIAAAARAAEEQRAEAAAQAVADQRKVLDAAREAEINALTGQMGLTKEEIETRILDLKQQIFDIEEQQIEPAQYQVELLERQEESQKRALTVLGMTRVEWETLNNRIQVAKTSSNEYKIAMEAARDVVKKIVDYWVDIEKPKTTIHTIITRNVTEGGAGNIGASGDSTGGSGNPGAGADPTPTPAANPAGNTSASALKTRYAALRAAAISKVGPAAKTEVYGLYTKWLNNQTSGAVYQNASNLGKAMAKYGYNSGGLVGGFGSGDTIPAMLTPGEFVVTKPAVDAFGASSLKDINRGTYKSGSVYNYSVSVNVNDANANKIAKTVISQIKSIDNQRIRGNRF